MISRSRGISCGRSSRSHSRETRAGDDGGVLLEFRERAQIEDDRFLTRLQHLMQLVNSDPRHAQLTQQAMPLEVLVSDVNRNQPGNQTERIASEAGERANDLVQLMAEQDSHKYKASSIKERTQPIEEKKTRCADARIARQRRRQVAQAGNELRRDDASHAVSREEVLCPANARVRLQ